MTYRTMTSGFFLLLLLATGNVTSFAENKQQEKIREIIIGFSKKADQKDIKSLEKKFSLTIVKKFKSINAICYRVPKGSTCKDIISKVKRESGVKYAELNGKVSTQK